LDVRDVQCTCIVTHEAMKDLSQGIYIYICTSLYRY